MSQAPPGTGQEKGKPIFWPFVLALITTYLLFNVGGLISEQKLGFPGSLSDTEELSKLKYQRDALQSEFDDFKYANGYTTIERKDLVKMVEDETDKKKKKGLKKDLGKWDSYEKKINKLNEKIDRLEKKVEEKVTDTKKLAGTSPKILPSPELNVEIWKSGDNFQVICFINNGDEYKEGVRFRYTFTSDGGSVRYLTSKEKSEEIKVSRDQGDVWHCKVTPFLDSVAGDGSSVASASISAEFGPLPEEEPEPEPEETETTETAECRCDTDVGITENYWDEGEKSCITKQMICDGCEGEECAKECWPDIKGENEEKGYWIYEENPSTVGYIDVKTETEEDCKKYRTGTAPESDPGTTTGPRLEGRVVKGVGTAYTIKDIAQVKDENKDRIWIKYSSGEKASNLNNVVIGGRYYRINPEDEWIILVKKTDGNYYFDTSIRLKNGDNRARVFDNDEIMLTDPGGAKKIDEVSRTEIKPPGSDVTGLSEDECKKKMIPAENKVSAYEESKYLLGDGNEETKKLKIQASAALNEILPDDKCGKYPKIKKQIEERINRLK